MKFYNNEKKEVLKLELELAMKNLSSCIAFTLSSETNYKPYYNTEQLFGEYSMLKDLSEVLDYCMIDDEEMEVCSSDYLLIKKWGWLDLQKYKALSSNIGE